MDNDTFQLVLRDMVIIIMILANVVIPAKNITLAVLGIIATLLWVGALVSDLRR